MTAAGKDGSAYGAHSLQIGGATARAYLNEPVGDTKAVGCWSSEACMPFCARTLGRSAAENTIS